jgi:hypothetical protein
MTPTIRERMIIERAVNNAACFGLGILTTTQEYLEDHGYTWTEELEKYVFETYVEGQQ